MRKFGGYKTEVKERVERRGRPTLKNELEREEHFEIFGRLIEKIGLNTYLHDPMDFAERM